MLLLLHFRIVKLWSKVDKWLFLDHWRLRMDLSFNKPIKSQICRYLGVNSAYMLQPFFVFLLWRWRKQFYRCVAKQFLRYFRDWKWRQRSIWWCIWWTDWRLKRYNFSEALWICTFVNRKEVQLFSYPHSCLTLYVTE